MALRANTKKRKVMCFSLQVYKLSYPIFSCHKFLLWGTPPQIRGFSVPNDGHMTTNTLLLQRSIHFIPWCFLLKKYDLNSTPRNLTTIYQKWPIFKRNHVFQTIILGIQPFVFRGPRPLDFPNLNVEARFFLEGLLGGEVSRWKNIRIQDPRHLSANDEGFQKWLLDNLAHLGGFLEPKVIQ